MQAKSYIKSKKCSRSKIALNPAMFFARKKTAYKGGSSTIKMDQLGDFTQGVLKDVLLQNSVPVAGGLNEKSCVPP